MNRHAWSWFELRPGAQSISKGRFACRPTEKSHSIRAIPDGFASYRRRENRFIQLAFFETSRREIHPPHRGYRPAPVNRRIHARHPRLHVLAGADLGRGPFLSAERIGLYKEKIQKLIDEGKAYRCTCTPEELEAKRKQAMAEKRKPKYDGACREKGLGPQPGSVVRFPGTGHRSNRLPGRHKRKNLI